MARKYITTVKVMKSGRITIPSDIREIEGIGKGDFLQISIEKIKGSTNGNRQKLVPKQPRYARNRRKQEPQNE